MVTEVRTEPSSLDESLSDDISAGKDNKPLIRESWMNVNADEIAFETTLIASEGPIKEMPPMLEPP